MSIAERTLLEPGIHAYVEFREPVHMWISQERYESAYDEGLTVGADGQKLPSPRELLGRHGNWNNVMIASGLKSFNGAFLAWSLTENFEESGYTGGRDGAENWKRWYLGKLDPLFYKNYLFGKIEPRLLGDDLRVRIHSNTPNINGLAAQIITKLVCMVDILLQEDGTVLEASESVIKNSGDRLAFAQWQELAEPYMGKGAVPSADQVKFLMESDRYLQD